MNEQNRECCRPAAALLTGLCQQLQYGHETFHVGLGGTALQHLFDVELIDPGPAANPRVLISPDIFGRSRQLVIVFIRSGDR